MPAIPRPYATGRIDVDADSHLMETENWLTPYADPGVRYRLNPPGFDLGISGVEKGIAVYEKRLFEEDEQGAHLLEMV